MRSGEINSLSDGRLPDTLRDTLGSDKQLSGMPMQQRASGDTDPGRTYLTQYYRPFTPIYNAPEAAASPDRLGRPGSKQSLLKKGKAFKQQRKSAGSTTEQRSDLVRRALDPRHAASTAGHKTTVMNSYYAQRIYDIRTGAADFRAWGSAQPGDSDGLLGPHVATRRPASGFPTTSASHHPRANLQGGPSRQSGLSTYPESRSDANLG